MNRSGRRPSNVAILVAVLVAVRVVAIVWLLGSGVESEHSVLGGDARRYEAILNADGTPYRDFPVEYPPITLAFTHLIDGPDTLSTLARLAVSQLALELAVAGVVAWAWGRRTGVAYLVLGTPMAFFPFPYVRIDLVSVFLAVAGLALVHRRWPRLGGAALGVSLLAKVWPLAVLPALAVRRQRRALVAALAVAGVLGLAWVAWTGTDGPLQVATFRGAKGWQIESLVGTFVHAADARASIVEQGAWRTAAAVPAVARYALPALGLATVAGAWLAAERRRRSGDPRADLLIDGWAPLAGVLGLLVFSTIISPQYLLWATPFAAIVVARGERGARLLGGLFLGAAALSTLGLAAIQPLVRGELWATGVVATRNLLLVAMLVTCLVELLRGPPDQATPRAMMDRMRATDATRSIDDVSSGIP